VVDATLPAGSDMLTTGRSAITRENLSATGSVISRIRPGRDELKALGAAMAATGAVGLFHVDGVTPDSRVFRFDGEGLEVIAIGPEETGALFRDVPVDAVAIGCPHCSPEELGRIAGLLSGRRVAKPSLSLPREEFFSRVETRWQRSSGAGPGSMQTLHGVSPGLEGFPAIMVNSGKALAYVPDMCGAVVRLGTLEECVREATRVI